jgi:hypothetical protein
MLSRIILAAFVVLAAGCAHHHSTAKNKTPLSLITFTGGNGESGDSAIVIGGVEKQSEGVEAEYQYLSKLYGEKGKGWRVDGQTITKEEKKIFDVLEITVLPAQQKRIYYFDVSKFPWKRK